MPAPPAVEIAPGLRIGGGAPLVFISGPCVIESRDHALRISAALHAAAARLGVPLVYKSSFDKANRSSGASFRGPGLHEGLEILAAVKKETGLPVLTDIHEAAQAAPAAQVADILQIPAFLCRQTDLLLAAAATGRAVNVKKGQFLAPWDARNIADKLRAAGARGIVLTERGTSFGYNTLVVDFRALPQMRALGVPVIYDATHSMQQPGGAGTATAGTPEHTEALSAAAAAVGVDGLFFEVHDDPAHALSDGSTQLPLARFEPLVRRLLAVDAVTREAAKETAR